MDRTTSISVRDLAAADVPACERILRSLPDWFGIEAANRAYVESLYSLPAGVALVDGRIVGFIALERHDPGSAEIHVMAVEPTLHRNGVGAALIRWARARWRESGGRWLHVKTRGPATPDAGYERTRAFYLAQGFEPLFESLSLWGPENAALVLIDARF
jgi:GNAT superfamily N-acetyltransferase